MTSSGSLQPTTRSELALGPSERALQQLPRHQGLWIGGSILTMLLVASLTPLWLAQPDVALTLAIAGGASVVNPRKLWAAPLVGVGVVLAGLMFTFFQLPAVIGAGAAAGAFATWLLPRPTDWLDRIHGALGGLAGSSLGLWAAVSLIPSSWPTWITAVATAGIVGLIGSQGLLPSALRFDDEPRLPTVRDIQRELRSTYRPAVFKALELYRSTLKQSPDPETRRGMAEVAVWVFRLQVTLQTLDQELGQIDPVRTQQRIDQYRDLPEDTDEFTRKQRRATADHLERLLEHRKVIAVERDRSEALVDYALAFLEEARAGLAVARELPGETTPDRLPEVLHRLRDQAREGDARRRTAREIEGLST
ncbi:MAG: hypothetical protein AAGA48_15365 [Myxococcota bacterium]